jgi:hypothetical protein
VRQVLLGLLGWASAVVVATAVGFAAISLVGDDVAGPIREVDLAAAPEATRAAATPKATRTRPPVVPRDEPAGPSGTTTRETSTQLTAAGSVTATCRTSGARLTSWSPRTGWSVGSVLTEGSGRQVVFTDGTTNVTVDVTCDARTPVFVVTESTQEEPTEDPEPTPSATESVPGEDDLA